MNFKIERDIESRVFVTKISFSSLGNVDMTPNEEAKMFEDFDYPIIDTGGSFSGKFKVEEGRVVLSEDPDAQELQFVLNSNKKKVDQSFEVELRINIDKIASTDIGEVLDNKIKVAEAKCLLFESEIEKRIREAVAEIVGKTTLFEDGYPKEFMV